MLLVTPLYVKSDLQWENSALQHRLKSRAVQKGFCFLPDDAHPLAFIQICVPVAATAGGDETSLPRKSSWLFEGKLVKVSSHTLK